MEPADLNRPSHDDEQLAAWYRAHVSAAPLPDDGFSQRVLTALPPARKSSAAKRRLFCLAGALFGVVTVFARMSVAEYKASDLWGAGPDFADAAALVCSPAFALALGITVVSLWYVFRPKLHFLPRF